jgi:hypothetical protein
MQVKHISSGVPISAINQWKPIPSTDHRTGFQQKIWGISSAMNVNGLSPISSLQQKPHVLYIDKPHNFSLSCWTRFIAI